MQTLMGNICSDIATLLNTAPYNEFLGFAIFGLIVAILIRWFKFR